MPARPPLGLLLLGAVPPALAAGAHPGAVRTCGRRLVLGVDYYPEQWPLEEMRADMASIRRDLGADLVRLGDFMWHELEPQDGVFNFTLLDRILGAAEDVGLEVMLATPTAGMPAWLYRAHPEVVSRGPDSPEGYAGEAPGFGGRRLYSFNSDVYRRYAARVVSALAERYGRRSSVTFWQVDNELGHEGSDLDFSNASLVAWRAWLTASYGGDIGRLNADWGTVFWGTTYNGFDEVPLPRYTVPGSPGRSNENFRSNQSPGMLLDFRRFRRDSVTSFAEAQVSILRGRNVTGCITTNMPGDTWKKALDFNGIFAGMDLAAYDNYPVWGGSLAPTAPSMVALALDQVRGMTPPESRGAGWMVAEQLIGAQGHDVVGYTPRPGQTAAWASQALLHGATAINFFRYRAAVFGQEELCYGILDHATPRGTGRKFQEAKALYSSAREHEKLWLAPLQAGVALLYHTDNIFAWQAQPQSTAFDFTTEAHRMYYPFWRSGAAVDVVQMNRTLAEAPSGAELLARYRVLLLPAPMLVPDAALPVLEEFVRLGGSVWVGFRSDLKDARSQMRRQPSRLASLAGVAVDEIESLNDPLSTALNGSGGLPAARATVWREGLSVVDGGATEALWRYTDDFFGALGLAAATRRKPAGGGEVVYVGAGIEPEALTPVASATLRSQRVQHPGAGPDPEVEQLIRRDLDGRRWHVRINHGASWRNGTGGVQVGPYAVQVAPAAAGAAGPRPARAVAGSPGLVQV